MDRNVRRQIISFSSDKWKQVFFSTDHCQRFSGDYPEMLESFTPATTYLPMFVVPRESLPDAMIRTVAQYLMIFHGDKTVIANPEPRFEALSKRVE